MDDQPKRKTPAELEAQFYANALDGDEHGGYPDMDATSADERTELLHRELREAGR